MHPQLSDKRIACKDFIEALQTCHASSWAKWTGGCNQAKWDLNECLKKDRANQAAENRANAKERRAKTEKAWQELKE